MRISHSDLEACRASPSRWVAERLLGAGGGPRYGYNQALKNAIYTYHRTSSVGESKKYLSAALKKFKNPIRKTDCGKTLEGYLEWAEASENVVASWRVRLNLVLHEGVLLGGEISRIDINTRDDHYLAILLGEKPIDWKNQLRMPLIQYEIARQFRRPAGQVRVGYQDCDGTNLSTTQFSAAEIDEALDESKTIGVAVHHEVVRRSGDF